MNAPPPDPSGETARLIVALMQIASDAGKCAQELRTPDQPWVMGAVVGVRNDAIYVTERCSKWIAEHRVKKPEPRPIPTIDEQRAEKKARRALLAMKREDAKKERSSA